MHVRCVSLACIIQGTVLCLSPNSNRNPKFPGIEAPRTVLLDPLDHLLGCRAAGTGFIVCPAAVIVRDRRDARECFIGIVIYLMQGWKIPGARFPSLTLLSGAKPSRMGG